ncbi:quinoprotein relay system zinc metallohydrolase 1 [Novosphingobium kunmingense]|uniref:Quinoprotein relay system zinc metallohydrolase 1 n=1 Tax=Novosphingobium kunmingense TaxID=1211806 RepID=A0A2N0H6B7_9SPHN|nr:quinoprotein relay system zinc metallohydrolase 1 [Novosphingobium kunmingense]PKB14494.1 quinoprotein relay system zinc metallohydrolase 1 [Novosphingobium kunmingense]
MKVTRRGFIAAALAASTPLGAETFAGSYAPDAEPIGQGIWLVRGADEAIGFANGGAIANSVILATDAGPLIVDPGPSRRYGEALSALAARLTGKPPARVFVTHLHPDHSFGAGAFDPRIVAALAGTRVELDRDGAGFSDAMYRLLVDWMRGTEVPRPGLALTPGPLAIGGRIVRVMALAGHSAADLALLDESTGTLIAGDLVFHDRAPATPHADLALWRHSLAALASTPHRQLVPGHGPLDPTAAAIAQTRDWLDWLEQALRDAVASGLDMTEAGSLPIPSRFAAVKAARYELQRSVAHLYPRFEAELLPRIDS